MTVQLSTVKPDYEDILAQLTSYLRNENSWKDLIEASTGQLLTKFLAGGIAYNQFTIERAVQENFLESALGRSGVYAMARDLGVRIKRKSPAEVLVSLTRTSTSGIYSIPAYTQFKIDKTTFFFNPAPITFNNTQATVTGIKLEEGEIRTTSHTSDGTSFQKFLVGTDFTSSDKSVRVLVNNVEWSRIEGGPWLLERTTNSFSDLTSILGEMEITFGNNVVGTIPPAGANLDITEFVVKGSITNTAVTALSVEIPSIQSVTGVTTSTISLADDEKDVSFYKETGARLGRAFNRAVTRSDYNAIAKTYPGVIDAICKGEYEINPGDQNWMSTVGVYLITASVWSPTQEADFLKWLSDQAMLGVFHVIEPTTAVVNDITAHLLVDSKKTSKNLTQIIDDAKNLLLSTYGLQQQRLGRDVYVSDIYDLLTDVSGVSHVIDLTSPATDQVLNEEQYFKLGALNITAAYL